jgi:hypothetical protein
MLGGCVLDVVVQFCELTAEERINSSGVCYCSIFIVTDVEIRRVVGADSENLVVHDRIPEFWEIILIAVFRNYGIIPITK